VADPALQSHPHLLREDALLLETAARLAPHTGDEP